MAALKWVMISVCSLAALGLTGLGITGSMGLRANEPSQPTAAKISLRSLPPPFVVGSASAKPTAATRPVEPESQAAVDAGVAAAPVVAPVAAPPVKPDAGAVSVAAPVAAVDAGAPAPVVRPPAPAVVAPLAVATVADGVLNLQASDTADVFVDGKRMGASPVLGVKVKVGAHKVRFDCYDAAGNTVAGAVQNVTAVANNEVDVSFTCPASE